MQSGRMRLALGLVLFGITAAAGLAAKPALAAPTLILLEDNGDTNPVYRQTIESLGAVIVANNLGHYYDHIDVLTGSQANRDTLFAQIRKRGAKSAVDLVLLTHGMDKHLWLTSGSISDQDIRAAGPFPRLRMVYMMACYSASLEGAWRDTGAQVVVGHQDVNSLSGFFFPRFMRRWAEGATAREAASDAYQFSEGTAGMLSTYIKEDQDYLSSVGVTRSEPVIQGVDIDRSGQAYPDHVLAIAPLASAQPMASFASEGAVKFSHTDFERMGISLLGTMIPQASLNVDAIPSAQELVNRIHSVAWDQLHDSFPNPSGDGMPDLDLPSEDGQQLWIDGEAIRYFLAAVRDYAGDKLGPLMDRVQGVRLTRTGANLNAAIYFDGAFDIPLQDKNRIPNWQPYSVHVPKTVRFSVQMLDSVLTVTGLDQGNDALNLKLKMPSPLPDSVWVRTASVSLSDGKAHVEAGVLGNMISVIANAELLARKFDGVDVWATIESNLGILVFPALSFQTL